MAAAVGGKQWHGLALVAGGSRRSKPSSFSFSGSKNEPLIVSVAQAKSISLKSVGVVGGATAAATTATIPAAAAAGAVGVITTASPVASSQQSNLKIKRSNRRSRFGEPVPTTHCDDDDDFHDALSADIHVLEMGFSEEDLDGRKSRRKGKKMTRAGAKRLASIASSQVIITQVPKGGKNPAIKQKIRSDGPNGSRIKSGAGGVEFKSARARSRMDDLYLMDGGDKFLSDAAWEERAYQKIRQQKLRDAALAGTTTSTKVRTANGLSKIPASESAFKITTSASPKQSLAPVLLLPVDAGGNEDGEASPMSTRFGLEDKCEALLAYLHSLGVRDREFTRIVDKHKSCLQANVNVVKERVEFLLSVGVQFQHIPKLVVRHPQILEYRVEQAMKPRVKYLKSLGLDESKIGKIITVSPSLLECSLERSIKPRISYLVDIVGIKSEDIGKIVMRSPQILTQSIEDSLEPRIAFYLNELKLSKEVLAKMVTRHPQLLHYSMEDGVRPRVKYLRSLGMSDADVVKVLSRLTQILSLSVEKCMQPKYNYLVKELKGGVHTVTSFPAYFSLSLDQRIIPRHRYSQSLERTPEGPFPMRLLTISDIAFCQWAKSSVEAYEMFRHDLLLSTFATNFERKNKVQI